jgi:hypothetical protein
MVIAAIVIVVTQAVVQTQVAVLVVVQAVPAIVSLTRCLEAADLSLMMMRALIRVG